MGYETYQSISTSLYGCLNLLYLPSSVSTKTVWSHLISLRISESPGVIGEGQPIFCCFSR